MTYEEITQIIKGADPALRFNRIEARDDGAAIVFSDPSTGPSISIGKTIMIAGVAEEDVSLLDEG